MNRGETVYLGLGSNLGDRVANLERAVRLMARARGITPRAVSGLYETAPEHVRDQPEFINSAVEVNTVLSPEDLLARLKSIERAMGRAGGVRYGPRIIDIDILLYGNAIIDEGGLCIPHRRMAERMFALFPLADIAEDVLHPVLGVSIGRLLESRLEARES